MGKKEGRGILTEPNGVVYDGPFHNNMKNGKAVYKYKDKIYEGFFENGKF